MPNPKNPTAGAKPASETVHVKFLAPHTHEGIAYAAGAVAIVTKSAADRIAARVSVELVAA